MVAELEQSLVDLWVAEWDHRKADLLAGLMAAKKASLSDLKWVAARDVLMVAWLAVLTVAALAAYLAAYLAASWAASWADKMA